MTSANSQSRDQSKRSAPHRVLMLVENNFPADTRVRNEAFTLVENGYQVTVICLKAAGEAGREVVGGVTVYRVPTLTLFEKLPDGNSSLIRRAAHRLMVLVGYVVEYAYFTSACFSMSLYVAVREGFDVVHAHNPPDTLVLVTAPLKLLGKKSVFDHHDLSAELYLSRYRTTTESPITSALRFFERLSVRMADVVIATNESYKRIDIERNGAQPDSVFIVRNGPDLRRVAPVEPDKALASKAPIVLGYVGAMNPQDGLDYLLRALAHLVHVLHRTDFYCVLIGSGDSLEELRADAVRLEIDSHVWFTSYIPHADMVRYLSTSHICLDPNPSSPLNDVSTWIKVLEYMALGKPVVSFDLTETRVSAGDAALFVKPNDEAAFASAIVALMDDPAQRTRMGHIGRSRVEAELGWHATSRGLLRAYEHLFRADSRA